MKIAIFENEIPMVEGAFEAMNLAYFENKIKYKFFTYSQEAKPYEKLKEYDIIFVDIQLTAKSELDGFNLITVILPIVGKEKLAIITGFSRNEKILSELGLPEIPIITKPVDFIKLKDFIDTNFPTALKLESTAI